MRLIYNSIIDTQSQLQHATNARPHTNGKNSPFSHPPKFPYKVHGDSRIPLKAGTENGVAKRRARQTWQKQSQICQNAKRGNLFRRHKGREFGYTAIFQKVERTLCWFHLSILTSQKMLGWQRWNKVYTVANLHDVTPGASMGTGCLWGVLSRNSLPGGFFSSRLYTSSPTGVSLPSWAQKTFNTCWLISSVSFTFQITYSKDLFSLLFFCNLLYSR